MPGAVPRRYGDRSRSRWHPASARFVYHPAVPRSELQAPSATDDFFDPTGNGNLPPMPYRDMPEPLPLRKVLGPSVILAGLGVGSGEYIIWPYMASTVGLGFLWAAVLSVTVQYFLNMEIERYTLATGETAVAGFVRFWKPWGLVFCLFTIVPNMWPGWATSGVTILTFLIGGGNVPYITCGVPGRGRDGVDRVTGRLPDARAGAVLQGRSHARLPGDRDCHGHRTVGVGRAADP